MKKSYAAEHMRVSWCVYERFSRSFLAELPVVMRLTCLSAPRFKAPKCEASMAASRDTPVQLIRMQGNGPMPVELSVLPARRQLRVSHSEGLCPATGGL